MNPRHPWRRPVSHSNRRTLIVLGVLACVLAVAALYIGVEAPNESPWQSYYTVHAFFRSADSVVVHDEVRLGGVDIGQVLNPRIKHGLAEVDLQLHPSAAPLRTGTLLRIRPRSLVGVQFVEVLGSHRGAPIPNGGTIPASHTSAAVTYDQVFNILDSRRRGETRDFVRVLGSGLAGRGLELNQTLQQAPSFFDNAAAVAAAVNDRPGATARFVASTAGAMTAMSPVSGTIASGFSPEARALAAFTSHAADVRATLSSAAPALSAAATQLPAVQGLLDQVDGLSRATRTALAPAPSSLAETNAMISEARPGLRGAVGTLRELDTAVDPVLNLLHTLSPVLPELNKTLRSSDPILSVLAPRGCDIKDFVSGWAESTAFGDAGGEFLRLGIDHPGIAQLQSGFTAHPIKIGFATNPYPAPCQAPTDRALP